MNASRYRPGFLKRRRGVILVLTLWISIVLSIMAFSLAYEMRVNLKLASQSRRATQALALARAGMGKAVVDLRNDAILPVADPVSGTAASLRDVWAQKEDKEEVEFGGGTYTVRVKDEEAKINVNYITVKSAPVVGYLIHKLSEIDLYESNMIANMILDWQDPDTLSSGGVGTSENEFWTDFAFEKFGDDLPEDWTFHAKNDVIISIDELLAIPGITRELLYGPPEEVAKKRKSRSRRDDEEEEYPRALSEYITVQAGRRLNVNTMPVLTMEALLSVVWPSPGEAESVSKKFQDYRKQLGRSDDNGGAFNNMVVQMQSAGIPDNEFSAMKGIMPIENKSYFFIITSTGTFQGVTKTLKAKVRVDLDTFQVDINNKESEGKRDEHSRAVLRNKQQFVFDPGVRVLEFGEL